MPNRQRQAEIHDADISRALRLGVPGIRRVLRDFKKRVRAKTKALDLNFSPEIRTTWELLSSQLRSAQVLAHARGTDRQRRTIRLRLSERRALAATDLYQAAVQASAKRADMGIEEIDRLVKQYDAPAVRLTTSASAKAELAMQEAMARTVAAGVHVREGAELLQITSRAVASLGMDPASPWLAETLFRTQMAMAYEAGRWTVNQSPPIDEIIWGYEYVAIPDDRVRPEHLALHGTRYAKDDPQLRIIWPPNGFNCRCSMIEIFTLDDARLQQPKPPPATILVDGEPVPVIPDPGFAFHPADIAQGVAG